MTSPLYVTNSIIIKAPKEKVWQALTDPDQTEKYMFGCRTDSDWKVGSQLLWKGKYEGKEMVFVKGTITTFDAPNKLVYTTFDPNGSIEDIAENYLSVTYSLTEDNGQTTLTVSQGDYSKVAEGSKRYEETYNGGEGWNPILLKIKLLFNEGV